MNGDEFIRTVSNALGMIEGAFRNFGMQPPKEVILQSKDDLFRLSSIKPTFMFETTPSPWDRDVAAKIRGVEFRARPSAVDRADARTETLRDQLEKLRQRHFIEVLALVNAAGGKVTVTPDDLHDIPQQTIWRHEDPIGTVTYEAKRTQA